MLTMTGKGTHTTALVVPDRLYVISPEQGGVLVLAYEWKQISDQMEHQMKWISREHAKVDRREMVKQRKTDGYVRELGSYWHRYRRPLCAAAAPNPHEP
jgi:hypothetical protein